MSFTWQGVLQKMRAEADLCIVKPELCHFFDAADPCRDAAFARAHCFRPHFLYLALTSALKIGITRRENLPTRWIDQGAVEALTLAELPSRREVGLLEHRLGQHFAHRTHWMRMLRQERPAGDPALAAGELVRRLTGWGVDGIQPADRRIRGRFAYPVRAYPTRVKSFNLDRNPAAGGTLLGIKGQWPTSTTFSHQRQLDLPIRWQAKPAEWRHRVP